MTISPTAAQQGTRIPRDVVLTRDVTYATVDGTELKLDIMLPNNAIKDPLPIVVYIHGGGWKSGDKQSGIPLLIPLARNGYMCFTVEYRLTGIANHPAQIHDCKAAIRWIRQYATAHGGDPDRIGVFGMSAGGHLAALLGTSAGDPGLEGSEGVTGVSSDVQAVCDWFGPSDLLTIRDESKHAGDALDGLLGDKAAELRQRAIAASPVTYIDGDEPPFLIIHGTADDLVPVGQSRELRDRLVKAGVAVELIEVPSGGHGRFTGTDPSMRELLRQMIDFFDTQLKGYEEQSGAD